MARRSYLVRLELRGAILLLGQLLLTVFAAVRPPPCKWNDSMLCGTVEWSNGSPHPTMTCVSNAAASANSLKDLILEPSGLKSSAA